MSDPYCARQVKVVLAISCLALVLAFLAMGIALAQEIDPKTIKPIDNKDDIEKAVNQLVKIHEFCWENKGCMVLRTDDYKRDQEELKALRQKAKEQCS